jgi:hypothetical protein
MLATCVIAFIRLNYTAGSHSRASRRNGIYQPNLLQTNMGDLPIKMHYLPQQAAVL